MDGTVVGFEYDYLIWTGENEITDEITSPYKYEASMGNNVFVFEVRTSFRVKRRRIDEDDEDETTVRVKRRRIDDDDEDETTVGSERFIVYVLEKEGERGVKREIGLRLQDYWMPNEEIAELVREAFDLARQQVGPDLRVIPIIIGVDICTVQQEGEELEHAMDRAIRAEKMAPICLWQLEYYKSKSYFHLKVGCHLKDRLPRIRVEDVDEGLELMETCPVCLRDPVIADQITLVPTCRHAFHSSCILTWLLKNNSCPLCRAEAYDYDLVQSQPLI